MFDHPQSNSFLLCNCTKNSPCFSPAACFSAQALQSPLVRLVSQKRCERSAHGTFLYPHLRAHDFCGHPSSRGLSWPRHPAVSAPPLPTLHRCFQALLARLVSLLVGIILLHFSFLSKATWDQGSHVQNQVWLRCSNTDRMGWWEIYVWRAVLEAGKVKRQ